MLHAGYPTCHINALEQISQEYRAGLQVSDVSAHFLVIAMGGKSSYQRVALFGFLCLCLVSPVRSRIFFDLLMGIPLPRTGVCGSQ